MTVIGSASINIRADDKYFEPDVRRAVAKIKDLRVALKVDADMSAANKKLRDLRYRMSKNEVQIKIRANDVGFEADVRAAVRKIKNVTIDLKADVDSSKASKKIRDLRYRITSKDAILKVDANVTKAEEKMRKLLEKFVNSEVNITATAHTGAAHTALSDLQTRYGKNVNYTATADTKVARAALALVARNRRAKITAVLDPTSLAAIKGAFNVLTGTLPFDKVRTGISGVVANFEGLAIKVGLVSTALLSMGDLALTAGANIFSIGGDITQVIGAASLLPAVFITMAVGIAATKMAWKGFGEALSSDPKKAAKAMAELPPEAQKAADSVRGLGREIQKATQAKFWEALGTSLQDMVTNLFPQVKEGFEYIGTALGNLQAASFDGLSKSLGDGVLLGILTNIGDMFTNMTEGTDDFIQGITTLGSVGATYLPQFGTYLSDLGIKFGEFIRQADEAGKINQWIDTSIRRFQELGSIVKSTTAIMSGLTAVARLSGAPGLTEMATGFRNVADIVNSEPFQSRLLAILEGAREGTEALGEGLRTLTDLFSESAESVSSFLKLAGEIAGLTFENITKLFDGTGLGSGLYAALQGLKDGMGELGPAFHDLGTAVGDLGLISAELFRSMAPGLNMLAETIAGVIGGLRDGIIDAMPIFNEFMQSILNLVSGPLVVLAQAVGNILSAFSELPGPIQTVIMSLGLLLLLKPKFDNFFGGMSKSLRKEDSFIGNQLRNIRDTAVGTMGAVSSATAGTGGVVRRVFADSARAAGAAFGTIGAEASKAGTRMGAAFGTAANVVTTALRPVAAGFREALAVDGDLDRVKDKLAETSGRVAGFAADQGSIVKGQFSEMATYSSGRMGEIGRAAGDAFRKIPGFAAEQVGLVKNQFADMGRAVDNSLAFIPSRAATAFAPVATSAAEAARGTAGAFKDTGAQIGRGFSTVSTYVRTTAGQIHGNLAPARSAFSALATHAGEAGRAAGTSLGGGVKKGIAGLSDVIGGGWGLALAGATIALGVYAQAQAESKARVEELSGALESQAGEWSKSTEKMLATNLLDGATNAWDDLWRGVGKGAQSVEESLSDVGITVSDVAERLSDSSGRESYLKGWDDINHAMFMTQDVTEEMASAVGSTADEINRLDSGDLQHLNKQIQEAGEEAARAEERARQLGEAFGTSTIESQKLAANYKILEDATSSVSDKFGALKSNMDILNGGTATATDTAKAYQQSLADTASAMSEISEREGVTITGLYDTAKGFDLASQAGRDMHTALEGSADAILMTATQAFQTARQGGKSVEEAQAIAVNSMAAPLETFRASLAALGFAPEQINGIVESFNLIPEEVSTALYADGSQATQEALRTELIMQSYADGNFNAVLGALPADAKAAIGDTLGLADEFAKGDYEAILSVFDDTPGGREAALAALATFDGTDWEAFLIANNLVPEEVAKANEAAQSLMPEKQIDLVAQDLASGVMATVEAYDIDGKSINLDAEDNISSMLSAINGSPLSDKQNQLTTLDLVTQTVDDLNAKELGGKLTELQAQDLVTATMDQINAKSLDGKTADFSANDLASMVLLGINATTMPNKELAVVASDLASGVMATVNAYSVNDRLVNLNANDLVSEVLGAVNSSPLMDKANHLTTTDLVTQIVNDVNNKQLNGKLNKLETQDLVSAVLANVNAKGLNSKDSKLTTADLVSAVVDSVNWKALNDKSNKLTTSDHVSPVINNINSLALHDKSNVVTTTLRTLREGIPQMANGGIMKGGVQSFADGGINKQSVKAFAGGGIENHTAQIARGAWPVRIWAEPETGGEAYIPLSPNKRKRSLAILKEVMAEFGLEHLTHSFADGGLNKAERYTTPTVISSRYAAASTGSVSPAAQPTTQAAAPVIHVHPSQGLNEEQIGVIASDRLWFNIQNSSF